jgi:hypothetical protein
MHDRRRRLQQVGGVTPMSKGDNRQNTEDVYARVREATLDGELAAGAVMS